MLPLRFAACYAFDMARILLTAFEPYAGWASNASWLALVELTRQLPSVGDITTRLYPVELGAMKEKLAQDLRANYDVAFHVGQAPLSSCIQLEEVALNVATTGSSLNANQSAVRVCDTGPDAYRCSLPIRDYARQLRQMGIPARTSFHAGTYLCNATLYWSCRLADELGLATKSTFVHVPLSTEQVLELDEPAPFMPSSMVAEALFRLVTIASTSELKEVP